jgi:hypothetical protein
MENLSSAWSAITRLVATVAPFVGILWGAVLMTGENPWAAMALVWGAILWIVVWLALALLKRRERRWYWAAVFVVGLLGVVGAFVTYTFAATRAVELLIGPEQVTLALEKPSKSRFESCPPLRRCPPELKFSKLTISTARPLRDVYVVCRLDFFAREVEPTGLRGEKREVLFEKVPFADGRLHQLESGKPTTVECASLWLENYEVKRAAMGVLLIATIPGHQGRFGRVDTFEIARENFWSEPIWVYRKTQVWHTNRTDFALDTTGAPL